MRVLIAGAGIGGLTAALALRPGRPSFTYLCFTQLHPPRPCSTARRAYASEGPQAHPVACAQASASRMVAQMKGSLASV